MSEPVGGGAGPAPRPERIVWIDATRGIAILTIVVYHTLLWSFLAEPAVVWGPAGAVWTRINAVLGSVRVPLLLLVSGLVVSRTIASGFGDPKNLRRAATSYYLYLVWLACYALFFLLVSSPALPHRIASVPEFLSQIVLPDTTLWYVFALAVFTLATAATRRWPPWLVLVLALAINLASDAYLPADFQASKIPQNWLFFVIGVHAAPHLRSLPRRANPLTLATSALVAAGIVWLGGVLPGLTVVHSLHSIVRSLALVATAALGVCLLVQFDALRRGLVYLGTRTLPIYLIHPLAIYGLIAVTAAVPALVTVRGNPVYAVLAPIVITALITLASIALRSLAQRVHLNWLFALPSWRRRSSPSAAAQKPDGN